MNITHMNWSTLDLASIQISNMLHGMLIHTLTTYSIKMNFHFRITIFFACYVILTLYEKNSFSSIIVEEREDKLRRSSIYLSNNNVLELL